MDKICVLDKDQRKKITDSLKTADLFRRTDNYNATLYYLIETFKILLNVPLPEETDE